MLFYSNSGNAISNYGITHNMTQDMTGPMAQVVVLQMCHKLMKNFSYLVLDKSSHQAIIVDPAWQIEKIEEALIVTQSKLSGILITHSHPDHIDLAKPVAEIYRCPIWMSEKEIAFSGFSARRLAAIDTKPWTVGLMSIEPIFTPGHTPGCTCYLIDNNLFTGDVLFAEGCGICPDTHAAHEMFASLQRLKTRLSPHTRIFPGHSYGKPPGQKMSQLLKDNIYLQFSDKHSFAAFRLRRGQNTARMFSFS